MGEPPSRRTFYALEDQLKLFEAVVTPTALYGSSAWALASKMVETLKETRRKMLRYVCRIHSQKAGEHAESWVDYMRRSARQLDGLAERQGKEDWTTIHRKRKWRFAGSIARQADGRWSTRILDWRPNGGQRRGRSKPKTRRTDDLERYAAGEWVDVAFDTELWKHHEHGLVSSFE